MKDNITSIKNFIFDDEVNDILLCYILNDELKLFYIYLIKYFCKKKDIALHLDKGKKFTDDLFTKNLQIFEITSEKIFLEISHNKKIVFTNYNIFKKFQNYRYKLNSYFFKNDLNIFLKSYLNIDENYVFDRILEYPYLIYSELFSYKINKVESFINKDVKNDFIINIRKDLFQLKRLDVDIKKIYFKLKDEVKYKKLNFLTY